MAMVPLVPTLFLIFSFIISSFFLPNISLFSIFHSKNILLMPSKDPLFLVIVQEGMVYILNINDKYLSFILQPSSFFFNFTF
jgi:hypothetical protein